MLFAVIVGLTPGARGDASWSDGERREFLQALGRSGKLLLEGTYGENGSLMLIRADDTNEAIALLQNDPCILAATSVIQIHPLALNHVGNLRS